MGLKSFFSKFVLSAILCTFISFSFAAQSQATDIWLEEFIGTAGTQPVGWWDETDDSAFNVEIQYSSSATITRTSDDTWGKTLSPLQEINEDTYPMLQIEVSSVSAGATWKVGIQEMIGSYEYWDLKPSSAETGVFTYDYAAVTGWTGVHPFKVAIIVEGPGGENIVVESVSIYHEGELPTETPTVTPTITETFTPTPTATIAGVAYLDEFVGTAGVQPAGWVDETDDANFNAEIAYSTTSGLATISRNVDSTWGKVLSPNQGIDVSAYPYIEISIPSISSEVSWKLGIQETDGSWLHYELQSSSTGTGAFYYDIASATGWSGVHFFKVEIIVEGAAGENIEVDYVKIIAAEPTPTPTNTFTATATPTIEIHSFWQEHFIGTAGVQPTGWEDETDDGTMNAEIAYSATASLANISRTSDSTWGKVLSSQQTVDLNMYPMISITVANVSSGATWKMGIQETEGIWQYWDVSPSSDATGTVAYDYSAVTGWTGEHNFKVVIIVEGPGGENIDVDAVEIYAVGPLPTVTNTPTPSDTPTPEDTATMTPTETPIPTDTPTSTPTVEGVVYLDNFDGPAGVQPAGWQDETDNAAFDAEIVYAAIPSVATIARNADSTWGKVLSPNQVIDLSAYPMVKLSVTGVSAGVNYSIGIQETEGSYLHYSLASASTATGVFEFDIAAATGWSGSHSFQVEIIVGGAEGESIDLDYLMLKEKDPTPTPTFTFTPTLTFTPTFTFTPTPTATIEGVAYIEVFDGTTGVQPAGWVDETDNAAFNAEITYSTTASWATVSRNADDTWGKVLSPNQVIDLTAYPFLEINVPAVSAGANYSIGIQETEGSYLQYSLLSAATDAGIYYFDIATATGWSGAHSFQVEIIVGGANGEYIEVDYVTIITTEPTPTPSATPEDTATFTVTETPEDTATFTVTETPEDTATFTPTATPEDTATFTPTETPEDTATFTATETPEDTATFTPTATPEDTATFTPTETPEDTPTTEVTPTATPTPLYPQRVKVWPEHSIFMQPDTTQNILAVSKYHHIVQPNIQLRYRVVRGNGTFGGNSEAFATTGPAGEPASVAFTTSSSVWRVNIIKVDNMGLGGRRYIPIIVLPGRVCGAAVDAADVKADESENYMTEDEADAAAEAMLNDEMVAAGVTGAIVPITNTPTYTPTNTPTPEPTAIPTSTEDPTEVPTEVPTEAPTEAATAVPATPVPATPVPTYTFTSTPIPTQPLSAQALVAKEKVVPYPNPARGRVNFAYKVTGRASITINVYTLSGDKIATIKDDQTGTGRILSTAWEAAGVAPGVYLVHVVITDGSGKVIVNETKKVALVK
jgi:hypothetical protein